VPEWGKVVGGGRMGRGSKRGSEGGGEAERGDGWGVVVFGGLGGGKAQRNDLEITTARPKKVSTGAQELCNPPTTRTRGGVKVMGDVWRARRRQLNQDRRQGLKYDVGEKEGVTPKGKRKRTSGSGFVNRGDRIGQKKEKGNTQDKPGGTGKRSCKGRGRKISN